jgi:ferredoxin-NADP reductase
MVLTLPVRDLIPATPRAAIVRLGLGTRTFAYRPGQAILIGRRGGLMRRPYSLATAPYESRTRRELEVLIGLDRERSAGEHLPILTPGVELDVEGPVGSFEFPRQPEERRFLFLAGGTGIAPLRAMLHEALARNAGWQLGLVYSARGPDEFAYNEELQRLAASGAITLRQTVTRAGDDGWAGDRGRIAHERIVELADAETLCFVCGPHPFVAAMLPALRQACVSPERVRVEDWGG